MPGSPDTPCSISLTSANVVKSTATAANDRGHHGKRSTLLGEPRCCGNLRSVDRAPQRHADHGIRDHFFARASAQVVSARSHRAKQGTAQLQVVSALRRLRAQGKRRRIRARKRGERALGQADPTTLDQAPRVLLRHDRRLGRRKSRACTRVRRLTASRRTHRTRRCGGTAAGPAPNAALRRSPPSKKKTPLGGALISTATGIRTRVSAMRGRRPSPLDDSGEL